MLSDFEKFAISNGISSLKLNDYNKKVVNSMISPNIVEERTGNPLQIDVFSKLFTSRILFLGTEIDADVANIINSQLLYLQMDNKTAPINLYINTPGGSVYDGLSIYDTMNYIDCPVYTTCLGLAASMGSILLTAGEKGHRGALPHSRIMIHEPMTGARPGTKCTDFLVEAEELNKLRHELAEILSKHSGKEINLVKEDMKIDNWFTPNEAVEYGLIDKVIKKEQ